MDSSWEYSGNIGVIGGYIHRTGKLWALAGWLSAWQNAGLTDPGPMCGGVERWGVGCERRDSRPAGCGLASCYRLLFLIQILSNANLEKNSIDCSFEIWLAKENINQKSRDAVALKLICGASDSCHRSLGCMGWRNGGWWLHTFYNHPFIFETLCV